jgi:hypothetical protein
MVRDTVVRDCAGDGLRISDEGFWHYDTPTVHVLDRVILLDNAGNGFYRRQDNGNGNQPYYLYATNVVATGNGGHGLFLDGVDDLVTSGDGSVNGSRMIVRMVNATLADNTGDGLRVWGEAVGGSGATVYNTIFAGNGGHGLHVADWTNNTPTVVEAYNNFFNNAGNAFVVVDADGTATNVPALAAEDLAVDPKFVAKPPAPYRLLLSSPLLDAGNNAVAPAVDILFEARPEGDTVSMGAYEIGIAAGGGTLMILR